VLRLLAEVGNVNIVTSDDVTGNVTIRMHNVPGTRRSRSSSQAKGLGMQRDGNIIRVAPQSRPRQGARARDRAPQAARGSRAPRDAPRPGQLRDGGELEERVPASCSRSAAALSVDERTNVLIVRDIGDNLNQVEELVRSLDTQTPQVLVEARIVEATSTFSATSASSGAAT
jgi:type IV pilus assembly protein PilQ